MVTLFHLENNQPMNTVINVYARVLLTLGNAVIGAGAVLIGHAEFVINHIEEGNL